MLSVQNIHLGQAENNETEVVHAARGGRRGGSRRGASRSSTRRWALGVGAATAGVALMGRTRLGRKVIRRAVRSKTLKGVRKAVLTRVRSARGTKVALGLRRFGNARRAGVRRVGNAAKQAVGRAYNSRRAAPVRGTVVSLRRRISVLGKRLRAKVRTSSKTTLARRR